MTPFPPPVDTTIVFSPIEQEFGHIPDFSQVNLIEISDHYVVLEIKTLGKNTTKLEIFRPDPLSGQMKPRIVVDGQPFAIQELAYTTAAQSEGRNRFKIQVAPILLGLAVAMFLWDCGSALYDNYVTKSRTLEVAIGECLIAGAIAVVSVVGGSITATAVKNALKTVVTKQILQNLTKAGVFEIIKFVASKIYDSILNAIKNLLSSYTPPQTPNLLVSWPNPIKVNSTGVLAAAYSDWDRDIRDIKIERSCGFFCWTQVGIWEARTKPNSDVGSTRFNVTCRAAGTFTHRVTVSDFGNRSASTTGTIVCTP